MASNLYYTTTNNNNNNNHECITSNNNNNNTPNKNATYVLLGRAPIMQSTSQHQHIGCDATTPSKCAQ